MRQSSNEYLGVIPCLECHSTRERTVRSIVHEVCWLAADVIHLYKTIHTRGLALDPSWRETAYEGRGFSDSLRTRLPRYGRHADWLG